MSVSEIIYVLMISFIIGYVWIPKIFTWLKEKINIHGKINYDK